MLQVILLPPRAERRKPLAGTQAGYAQGTPARDTTQTPISVSPAIGGVEALLLQGGIDRVKRAARPAHTFTQGPGLHAPGKPISGQMARFTVFQKKRPGQLCANRAAHIRNCGIGVDQATRRSPVSTGSPIIRRSSAATPSNTAHFSFIRFEWW
jgi:hypothetical protein